ncbi:MAG: ATP-binding protein [Nitrospirota bacterium]
MNSLASSIKGRLFLWIFFFITGLLIILGISIYQEVRKNIYLSVELVLHSKIQILKGLMTEKDGEIKLERAEVILGEYSIPRSGHYYTVLVNKKVLATSPSLVEIEYDLASGDFESSNGELKERVSTATGPAGELMMVIQHDFEIFGKPATIFAAQTLEDRIKLLDRFNNFLLGAILVSIFVVASVSLWITRRSLIPLKEFSSKIEKITHKTMSDRIEIELQAEEIKGLAKSFNAMLNRLEKAFDMKKRLIADVSHELKTPLSVIRAQCDVLLEKDREKEEYTHALNTVRDISGSMKKLIDDMLSLTRLDSGVILSSSFQSVSIPVCLSNAIKLAEVLAKKRRITIDAVFAEQTTVLGDQNALTEAFLNIIENAIRYNVAGGRVGISTFKDTDGIKIMVEDTGPGMAEDELEKIFDRFYQIDTSRGSESTGLGLSIARAIIEAHGGTIRVTSEIDKGSCFTISLPLH